MTRLFLALLFTVAPAVMTNDDVLALAKAGLSPDVIIAKITTSTPAFHTEVRDLLALKAAHVDDRVVQAMVGAGKSAAVPSPVDPALPPVRFGSIFIDLPGVRTYEGTVTIGPSGIGYEAAGFGSVEASWTSVQSVCYEDAYFGSLFVRVRDRFTGTAAGQIGRVVLLKSGPNVVRPAYEYLKRMHPAITDDCSDKGKDV